jgi:uncharacterized protein YndB with AHSA1/START domain
MPLIEVYSSAVIPAAPDLVWALLRDFDAMPQWNPTARTSRIEAGPADRIGCRRILTFDDGSEWTHELTALCEPERAISYAIIDGPPEKRAAIRNYFATMRVEWVTESDASFVTWRARFEGDTEEMRPRAKAVFQAGLDGLKRRFGG